MDYSLISFEVSNRVAVITLNREPVLNAMNVEMKRELDLAITEIENSRDIWGVIITGKGRAFSSGTDINDFPSTVEDARKITAYSQKLLNRIETLRQPVIAAVNGHALGGGLELALVCDIRICSRNAKLGFPEVKIGAIPCYGGTQRMTRLIGSGKTKELIFTGRMVDADEALELGLVNSVVQAGEELGKAMELMEQILSNSPLALSYAKQCIDHGADFPMERSLELEQNLVSMLVPSYDMKEGTRAFLEKRQPAFKNC